MHIDSCEIRKLSLRAALLSFMLIGLPLWASAQGVDINDTRLLSRPAISKNHVAFTYAGDLWVAGLDGKNVKRLTADEGQQAFPAFSPDGSAIAFTAQYDGNPDVYVVPVAGGVPTRLVEQMPADVINGRDPQLEKAIQVVMEELKKNPLRQPQRPPLPVRNKLQQP
jgi:tricorn protease